MLQHFPSRENTRDAVIQSDLAADCLEAGVTESALRHVCNEIRRGGSENEPFLPATGEILKRAKERTKYENQPKDTVKPKPIERAPKNAVQWYGKHWSEFTENDKRALAAHLTEMEPDRRQQYIGFLQNFSGYPRTEA